MTQPIKVLLVEDHELTRKGLSFAMGDTEDLRVVAVAEDGKEAIACAESALPDVILMDIALPILNGIEATRIIKTAYPEMKVIMLTSHNEQEKVFSAFAAGAEGYCMKDIKMDLLMQVIRLVKDGAIWMDPVIARMIMKVMPLIAETLKSQAHKEENKRYDLTERELEILSMIADGLNNKDISEKLAISLFTVKSHVSNIIQKLSVEDRTQAAVLALKQGIIQNSG